MSTARHNRKLWVPLLPTIWRKRLTELGQSETSYIEEGNYYIPAWLVAVLSFGVDTPNTEEEKAVLVTELELVDGSHRQLAGTDLCNSYPAPLSITPISRKRR